MTNTSNPSNLTPSPGLNPNQEILAKAAQAASAVAAETAGKSDDAESKLAEMSDSLTIADLKAGRASKEQLLGLMALLGVKPEPVSPTRRWDEFKKVYQFPSAPTSFHFSFSKTGKINIPEGIYGTNDDKEIEELEAAAQAGNIWHYSADINYAELAPTTKIPQPVRTDALN